MKNFLSKLFDLGNTAIGELVTKRPCLCGSVVFHRCRPDDVVYCQNCGLMYMISLPVERSIVEVEKRK